MPRHIPRLPRLTARLVLATLLGLQLVAVAPAPVGAADKGFRLDLAGKGDFVAQTNFVQCVGASMQMMLNIIGPRDDRTARTQLRLQDIARDLSGPTREGFARQGASVRGWAAGLNQLAAGPYRLVGTAAIDGGPRAPAPAVPSKKPPARAVLPPGAPPRGG